MQFVLVRILGVEQFGVYTIIWTAAITVAILGKLGYELSSIRYIADYRVHQQWALMLGFIKACQNCCD